ncbi:methionine--tRNA ligase [candidate division CPR3 bacterium GWF2_35_18]|uniref:Methionine--tRNA ligase n=1 Tax=candidate division CPR3 bacterium GW2011_GWF2_35_18 TaxID=1618350 RepID=A0A0G0BHH1_UNCC3|nr:MAG: Methionine-tRNA ligase [candidate division CPR3 bacterium GW2011_GWF2_35_18]OGB63204.1 MAG: methionine--tRNA ligase [candidate division CPR3 bacterium GWF2_35_18]OGB64118.1 MAG: methionine--tRNA ligase [candidate division CPR3 bacterium RIFOXYA2_FULL_35_13]OGB75576.1 MAG: methionine--tRNA ligase [candidate division CPR3 bacterium RIFOXYC2_FULL_35_7]
MNNKYYITAAIPYVNGKPHIGHALEFVQTDVISRYHRLMRKEVIYLSGADENGLKMVQAAERENLPVQEFCDRNAQKFIEIFKKLNTTLDFFQRASSKIHKKGSQELWKLCEKNGDIYKKKYKGLYCVGCETFYTKDELVDGKCPEHLKVPEVVEEENYFFKLSKYEKPLLKLFEENKIKIVPEHRKNEVISFIKQGLEDLSISRSKERAKGWGVAVPNDEKQIIYIWFDALNVYQTGVGFGTDEKKYQKWWPADTHVIGKGILRFHAIYWPAILLSAHLELPKTILVHGYVNSGGQKMSKSLGNVIDPFIEIEKYGVDAIRYYLLSQILPTEDGDYNGEQFKKAYNGDLANGLGNVVARIAKLCEKSGLKFESNKTEFKDTLKEHKFHKVLEIFQFDSALKIIWEKIKKLDQRINNEKPWEVIKDPKQQDKIKTILSFYVQEIREIACLLEPFLPDTSQKIKRQFSGKEIQSEGPLFPRLI